MSAPVVLVVAAHPDDEVLGCGATIRALAVAGAKVLVAILGEGITSRHGSRAEADTAALESLREDARRAADVLGVENITLHGLPDNRFDTVAMLDVVKVVEELIDRIRPEVVYTHHGGDLNVDHSVVNRAVLTATRPMAGTPVKEILAFEVPSSTDWAFRQLEPSFRPTVFVDAAATLDRKLAAMEAYGSERRAFPHPRSPEALAALARYRGSTVGLDAAEAFELVRRIS